MKKFLTIGAAIALALGFASCNKDKSNIPDVHGDDVDTYVGVSISFPAPSMRALPGDFNMKGEWEGRDAIKTITVYVVTDGATINSTTFNKGAFDVIQNGVLKPNLAVEAKSGQEVKAYVVINDINGKVIAELNKLGAAEFDSKFAETVVKVTEVSEVAKFDGTNDVVVMTNDVAPEATSIQANIDEEAAKKGPKNLLKVNVSRVVDRGIVTLDSEYTKEINIERTHTVVDYSNPDAPTTKTEKTTTAKVTVTGVEYQVTGSPLQFNVLQATDWKVPTAVYNFMPTGSWDEIKTSAAQIMTYTDESAWKAPIAKADNSKKSIIAALGEEQFSKFALPVTHATDGGYKKGNTTMFEIKAKFEVKNIDEGGAETPVTTTDGTVYLGLSDGKFYTSQKKAEAMDVNALETSDVKKQEVKEYKNGEMYYYIWLNPDVLYSETDQLIKESPTVRNHIYNAHITGFGEMGVSSKDEIDPEEDLETKKTHLSVEIKVLPWTIHSYEVNLGNRY